MTLPSFQQGSPVEEETKGIPHDGVLIFGFRGRSQGDVDGANVAICERNVLTQAAHWTPQVLPDEAQNALFAEGVSALRDAVRRSMDRVKPVHADTTPWERDWGAAHGAMAAGEGKRCEDRAGKRHCDWGSVCRQAKVSV